jgi:hypothetical protein
MNRHVITFERKGNTSSRPSAPVALSSMGAEREATCTAARRCLVCDASLPTAPKLVSSKPLQPPARSAAGDHTCVRSSMLNDVTGLGGGLQRCDGADPGPATAQSELIKEAREVKRPVPSQTGTSAAYRVLTRCAYAGHHKPFELAQPAALAKYSCADLWQRPAAARSYGRGSTCASCWPSQRAV